MQINVPHLMCYNAPMNNDFTKPLIAWYQIHKRDLIFRNTRNPYHIWVSEIMAQQTQIKTMLPYYFRWMEAFPTIKDLAAAEEQEVLKLWEGLGYYSRARNLHKGAKLIVEKYDGIFPTTLSDIESIPGIGDYSSRAIYSIAYNKPAIAIDGNVIRLASRYYCSSLDYTKVKNKESLKARLFELQSGCEPNQFTQALMELGALVCTPKNPQCESCPLKGSCQAYRSDTVANYPFKKVKKPIPDEYYRCFVCVEQDAILLSLHKEDSLMEGYYRLPQLTADQDIPFEQAEFTSQLTHTYSHKHWHIDVYRCQGYLPIEKEWIFYPLHKLHELPMIGAHRKILLQLGLLKAQ